MADGNIEKQLEGNSLALAAVAEVLQKMDARLAKEEADKEEAEAEAKNAVAKAELVKSIAREVLSVMKNEVGMDVSGDDRPAKGGGSATDADDSSENADLTTDISEQQNTIQAASLKKEEDEEEEEEIEAGGMAYKDDEDDDEAIDIPEDGEDMEKDENGDDDEDEEIENMKKQIAKLTKQLAKKEVSIEKQIKAGTEESLRKMGFREETSLKAPKIVRGLGVDNTPIVKAKDDEDVADQLASMSYKQLRDLQYQIEQGNTDGVPRELLG